MLKSFKNLELLRYYVSSSIEKNFKNLEEVNEKDFTQLARTVFSTSFTLVATFISTKYMMDTPTVNNIITILVVYCVGYLLSCLIYDLVNKKITYYKNTVTVKYSRVYLIPTRYVTIVSDGIVPAQSRVRVRSLTA